MTNTALNYAGRFVEVYQKLSSEDFCKFMELVAKLDSLRREASYTESELKRLMDTEAEEAPLPVVQTTWRTND